MTRFLYNLLFPLAFLVILPRYLVRMFRRGDYRRDFGQRFARYTPELRARFDRGEWIWVHAVSVGELLVALKLLDALHRRHPAWRFAVSSTTSTAHALALERQTDWWIPLYTPVDFSFFVRRALNTVRPRAIVLTESEMWPNFIWMAHRRRIPVVLVNARVSPRSARRYHRFAPILRAVTQHLHEVGLQEESHAALWEHLGVLPQRLRLTGSVKYDPDGDTAERRDFRPVLTGFGFGSSDPILLGGSTHEGEEEILADSLRILREQFPTARLLIAPRHVERAAKIATRLAENGFRVARRTETHSGPAPDILLLNTTGELRDWYACADAIFIGKSLSGSGGQNPVEGILAKRPIIFGPQMENFAALRDALLATGGAIEIPDVKSLAAETARIFSDPSHRARLVANAGTALLPHHGATSRTAELVENAVMGSDSPRTCV